MSEARKDKRSLLSLNVCYNSATIEDFIQHYSGDISRGGVFIKSQKPLTVGTLLKFEFLLEDESPLIHGVGRVVWRRHASASAPGEPPGMGVKFIKMDPQCRALVQDIVEKRQEPGAFERGNEGAPTGVMSAPSLKETPSNQDSTSIRDVSEFLASAMSEGGAAASTTREAQAGAERAREAAAQGALRARGTSLNPDRSARRRSPGTASSAFGARPAVGLDAQQTLPQGFETKNFDSEATIVNQAVDPALMAELRGALAERQQTSTANTLPPLATPVVPRSPGLVDASVESLWPAPAPPMPAITAPEAVVPTYPVTAQAGVTAESETEDETGPIDLVSVAPTPAAETNKDLREAFTEAPEAPTKTGNNPLAQLHDAPAGSGADVDSQPPKKKSGRGLVLGFVVFLLGGVAVLAWQTGLLGPGAQRAGQPELAPEAPTAPEVPTAPETAAVADPAESEEASATDVDAASAIPTNEKEEPEAREVKAEETAEAVEATRLPYVIEIVTRPPGALVKANESLSTRTPGEIRFESKPDSVVLLIRKQGYRSKRVQVDLASFVSEPDRHVMKLRQSLVRQRSKVAEEPAEDALDQLASAAAETAAAQADTPTAESEPVAPAAEPEAARSAESDPVQTAPKPEEPSSNESEGKPATEAQPAPTGD